MIADYSDNIKESMSIRDGHDVRKEVQAVSIDELNILGNLIATPLIIMTTDEVLYINDLFTTMTGYDMEDLMKSGFNNIIDTDQQYKFYIRLSKALKGKKYDDMNEFKLRCKDGSWIWVDYQTRLVSFENKIFLLLNLMDITEKKMKLDKFLKLRDAMLDVSQSVVKTGDINLFYQMILTKAMEAIPSAKLGTVLLKKDEYLEVSAQSGFRVDSITGFKIPLKEAFIYIATKGRLDEIAKIDDLLTMGNYPKISSVDDEDKFIRSTITAPIYINDEFFGTVNVDSTKVNGFNSDDLKLMEFVRNNVEIAIANHLLYQEKVYLSRFDSLTGLFNRSHFEEIFKHHREKALRYNEPFQLVLFDMNDLKKINDVYGHIAGDQVIKTYSDYCSRFMRKSDVISRYGGDEFVGLFFGTTRSQLSRRLNSFLTELSEQPVKIDQQFINFSFSFGIATFGEDGTELEALFKIADQRMYRFKTKYKHKINGQS